MTDFIARWLDLLDTCERAYNARDHPNLEAAFAVLYAYDHTLTAAQRVAARIARWRRDSPHEPLPPEPKRQWWADCLCHACLMERLASTGQLAPWQRQQQTLNHQQQKRRNAHVWNDYR
jgi:hypothetical protein